MYKWVTQFISKKKMFLSYLKCTCIWIYIFLSNVITCDTSPHILLMSFVMSYSVIINTSIQFHSILYDTFLSGKGTVYFLLYMLNFFLVKLVVCFECAVTFLPHSGGLYAVILCFEVAKLWSIHTTGCSNPQAFKMRLDFRCSRLFAMEALVCKQAKKQKHPDGCHDGTHVLTQALYVFVVGYKLDVCASELHVVLRDGIL